MISTTKYSIKEIADAINTDYSGKNEAIEAISWNSKEKHNRYCYFVFKGDKYDGIDFVNEAIKNGASLIVSDRHIECKAPVLYVDNPKNALCDLAKYHKGQTKIIGITGSSGKTTTKEMIGQILQCKYKVISTTENENNEIGVAKTLLSINNEDICVVEMGMRKRGEISYLSSICIPNTSVVTNAQIAHLGELGSTEEIFLAKTEIIKNTKEYCILPYEERFLNCNKYNSIPIYVGENGDVFSSNITNTENGLVFNINDRENKNKFFIPSFCRHNIVNSLFAYCVGRIYSVEFKDIKNAISEFINTGLRENIQTIKNITFVLDCYNASFDGMKSSIEGFMQFCRAKKLRPNLLLGKMYELGNNEWEYHYRIGEYARDIGVYDLIAYGDCAEYYIDGFLKGIAFDSKKSIAEYIVNNYNKNDAILIKAGRADKLEEIIKEMKEI